MLNYIEKDGDYNLKEEYAHLRANMLDVMGRFRTLSLFWEKRDPARQHDLEPLFTLKPRPHTVPTLDKKGMVTYPSLKQIYMSYDHVPGHEYEFAMDVFGSWQHWNTLCASMVRDTIQEWKDELAIKIKAEAIRSMMIASKEPSAMGVNAAKYLAEEGYVPKKVGRITKEEKLRQVKEAAGIRDTLAEDMDRLGLSIVNGTK